MKACDCDAARRNARARHEIRLAWGSGSTDFRRLLAILTDPEELGDEEAAGNDATPEGDHVLPGR
ncbi:hypothetical protein [Arthrobacter sp. R-11]|uniref:hypothetical protein n=1 Tax=Arthrobacter sp. R-11 TaxID=3404053 RepID=UPI003CED8B66